MKTSIIISTIAAVCLMITFSENTINRVSENNTNTLYSNISYLPANNLIAIPEVKWSDNIKADVSAKTKVNLNQDFSYLKFDVADYSEVENMEIDENAENSYEYLKFTAGNYEKDNELISTKSTERMVIEFDYLKFDVNNFTATGNDGIIESPANEFDYLKFDLNKYTATDIDETIESPVNEFDYLKFNVNKYSSNDKGSNQCVELQITE